MDLQESLRSSLLCGEWFCDHGMKDGKQKLLLSLSPLQHRVGNKAAHVSSANGKLQLKLDIHFKLCIVTLKNDKGFTYFNTLHITYANKSIDYSLHEKAVLVKKGV